MNAHYPAEELFRWQGTYAAISVSPRALQKVRDYVRRQEEHHRANSIHSEYEKCSTMNDSEDEPFDSSTSSHVGESDLGHAYRAMAADMGREAEAMEWAEATIDDIDLPTPVSKLRPTSREGDGE
jgi:hypothetical protein